MSEQDDGSYEAKRRKLFQYADTFGLTREERIDLAEFILRRDISSYKTLSPSQVDRMLDAFEGAALIFSLLEQRGSRTHQ